jgi:aspartokinase/homoserine dehydrogenase 1
MNLRVIALSNSRKMIFDEDGIDLKGWQSATKENPLIKNCLLKSKDLNLQQQFLWISLQTKVFLKHTSIFKTECRCGHLQQNCLFVCFDNYKKLKHLSRRYNAPFLFETNVGAGLPIIDTVKNLVASGDQVNKIQAVLSGSLNFIFLM